MAEPPAAESSDSNGTHYWPTIRALAAAYEEEEANTTPTDNPSTTSPAITLTCPICQIRKLTISPLQTPSPENDDGSLPEDEESAIITPCGHVFGAQCFKTYTENSRASGHQVYITPDGDEEHHVEVLLCPICRDRLWAPIAWCDHSNYIWNVDPDISATKLPLLKDVEEGGVCIDCNKSRDEVVDSDENHDVVWQLKSTDTVGGKKNIWWRVRVWKEHEPGFPGRVSLDFGYVDPEEEEEEDEYERIRAIWAEDPDDPWEGELYVHEY
ncbi:hypothetical protein QBC35DRAFT_185387 [Podospora australis]|uniref:RING-type domain-containing protein n=1 Tax=Podospora australis TaxID=1536484 RepID=A0AAN6WZC9_9PEZI|nr:hypothetical protein QBC35DRAFT_185387 [Podospora australis]